MLAIVSEVVATSALKSSESFKMCIRDRVYDLHLLTDKPVLYVCNVDEKSAVGGDAHVEAVRGAIREENAELLIVCLLYTSRCV